jgi:hypothetical protein
MWGNKSVLNNKAGFPKELATCPSTNKAYLIGVLCCSRIAALGKFAETTIEFTAKVKYMNIQNTLLLRQLYAETHEP